MNIKIRSAEKRDCTAILELVKSLAAYEKAPDEIEVDVKHYEETGFGSNPVWWAYVVEINGNVEGFSLYYLRFSTWKGVRLYLEDFYVNEAFRGLGIGKLLFERTIQDCAEKNYNGMVWQVLDWNEAAINFYKKYDADFDAEWLNGSLTKVQIDEIYKQIKN